jgi:hypothetical protein
MAMRLAAQFQSAADKDIPRFVGAIQGTSGVGKSTLIGSAARHHDVLVADVEGKGWGKYPRFSPPTQTFDQWRRLILQLLKGEPGMEVTIDNQTLSVDTLVIDTFDRLQGLAEKKWRGRFKHRLRFYGKLKEEMVNILDAIDESALNVILVLHVGTRTPTAVDAIKKGEDDEGVSVAQVKANDLGIAMYDEGVNTLTGSIRDELPGHMHFVLNMLRTPEGDTVLATRDVKVNGVLYTAKDDFGFFGREDVPIQWHASEPKILGDPLAPLWALTRTGAEHLSQVHDLQDEFIEQWKQAGKAAGISVKEVVDKRRFKRFKALRDLETIERVGQQILAKIQAAGEAEETSPPAGDSTGGLTQWHKKAKVEWAKTVMKAGLAGSREEATRQAKALVAPVHQQFKAAKTKDEVQACYRRGVRLIQAAAEEEQAAPSIESIPV